MFTILRVRRSLLMLLPKERQINGSMSILINEKSFFGYSFENSNVAYNKTEAFK